MATTNGYEGLESLRDHVLEGMQEDLIEKPVTLNSLFRYNTETFQVGGNVSSDTARVVAMLRDEGHVWTHVVGDQVHIKLVPEEFKA